VHGLPRRRPPLDGAGSDDGRPDDPPPSRSARPLEGPCGVTKFHAPEVVFGPGSLAEAGFCTLRLGGRRPLVVTDPGIIEVGWVDELERHLGDVGLSPRVWSSLTPNPKDHEVAAAFEAYQEAGCDIVIGIGGGSCMDAAKGVAVLAGNGGDILDYAGVDQAPQPIPPTVMVPSTAGTGADVSQFCIVTDTARAVKVTIMGRALAPDISVTDPRLTATMSSDLAAATGLDALTHAVEAYVSLAHSLLTDVHALTAAALVARDLERSLAKPREGGPRIAMAQAALEAGMAFTNAILGATHAMSHQVGGLLDAPHGVINAILLPHVIRYNAAVAPERFVALALAVGLPVTGMPAEEAADALADWVSRLAARVGVPSRLADLGLTDEDVPGLAASTLDDTCLATNPRRLDAADVESLFRVAM
jgi:alcohol dehydrogenase class IV